MCDVFDLILEPWEYWGSIFLFFAIYPKKMQKGLCYSIAGVLFYTKSLTMQKLFYSIIFILEIPAFLFHELSHLLTGYIFIFFGDMTNIKVTKAYFKVTSCTLSADIQHTYYVTKKGHLGSWVTSLSPLIYYILLLLYSIATLNLWLLMYIFIEHLIISMHEKEGNSSFFMSDKDFESFFSSYEAWKNYENKTA